MMTPEQHDKLMDTQRIAKFENGLPVELPITFKDEKVWLEIKTPEMFLKIFSPALHHLAYKFMNTQWCFVRKDSPKLNNIDELKKKADELIKKYETELLVYVGKYNTGKPVHMQIDIYKTSFYVLEEIVSKIKTK